ncbi:MAG: LysM peptidoglycan-binding domain-containing protein, partial [Myxococcota bacterium]|nr:LysM peptidoglycan-binding domain-containing protein [Myxococcota bacterium]
AEAVKVSPEVAALGKKYDLGAAQFSDKYGVSFERGYVGLEKGKVTSISVPFEHTVKPGDTLTKIAKKFETTVDFLAAANEIKDPNKIQVGQKLNVGLSGQVVMPGDTLSKYAKETGVTVADIARLNGITDPNKIRAGDVIGLPWAGC